MQFLGCLAIIDIHELKVQYSLLVLHQNVLFLQVLKFKFHKLLPDASHT